MVSDQTASGSINYSERMSAEHSYSCTYEEGLERLEDLITYFHASEESRNEAATRLQLIDDLFFLCLGWEKQHDVEVEVRHDGKFSDYVFSAPRQILIVEAKREDISFTLPAGSSGRQRSLRSLLRDYQDVGGAIRQAAEYCQARGVPYGCVANGHQLIAFIAIRTDGIPPLDGKAMVFDSLESMREDFQTLWDALSKNGIEEKRLPSIVGNTIREATPAKPSSRLTIYPGTKARNPFQVDLQILSELVIEDLPQSEELEEEFLRTCYASSGALSQYAVVGKQMLRTRYAALTDEASGFPAIVPAGEGDHFSEEIISSSLSRRPLLLLGDVGVGKTSFIRHLMIIDAPEIFNNAISLYINLGTEASLSEDIRSYVLKAIPRRLKEQYSIDIYESTLVRGVHNFALQGFRGGVLGELKSVNESLYLEKEISFLEDLIADTADHVQASLKHLSRGRKQQIIIILDNADQRDEKAQQEAFLIAQEMASNWEATVILPLRPETYALSVQEGALSGYHPKAFTIAPPRIDIVVNKRLEFAHRITTGDLPIPKLSNVAVNLEAISVLMETMMFSLKHNKSLYEGIDNLAGGNVRRALDMVRGFFGSGHVNAEKIVKLAPKYVIPIHEFMRALIFGDSVHYSPVTSPVANVFDVSQNDYKEHFLTPIMILALERIGSSSRGDGFASTRDLYNELQSVGYSPGQIDNSLVRAQKKKLIETAARLVPVAGSPMPRMMRVTAKGKYHTIRLPSMFTYIDAVWIDTPILIDEYEQRLEYRYELKGRIEMTEIFVEYLDACWSTSHLDTKLFDWPKASQTLNDSTKMISHQVR